MAHDPTASTLENHSPVSPSLASTQPTTSPTSCSRSTGTSASRRRRCSSRWSRRVASAARAGAASTTTPSGSGALADMPDDGSPERARADGALVLASEGLDTLFGAHDENLRRIERAFSVSLSARGNEVRVGGAAENVRVVEGMLEQLSALLERGYRFRSGDVQTAIRVMQEDPEAPLRE